MFKYTHNILLYSQFPESVKFYHLRHSFLPQLLQLICFVRMKLFKFFEKTKRGQHARVEKQKEARKRKSRMYVISFHEARTSPCTARCELCSRSRPIKRRNGSEPWPFLPSYTYPFEDLFEKQRIPWLLPPMIKNHVARKIVTKSTITDLCV